MVLKIRYKALHEEKRLQLDSEGAGYYWALKIDTTGRGRGRRALDSLLGDICFFSLR